MKKRFLASLLSLVMLLTMLPVTAFAAGASFEAVESPATLVVTATADTDSKLTLSVKKTAEDENEVQAYSYALHTTTVADKDALLALLNGTDPQLTPTTVTNGTVGDNVIVDSDKTHVIVYTVSTEERSSGKIDAWACVEIKTSGSNTPVAASGLTVKAEKGADGKVTLTVTGADTGETTQYLTRTDDPTAPNVGDAPAAGYKEYTDPFDLTTDHTYVSVVAVKEGKITKWGKAQIEDAATSKAATLTATAGTGAEARKITVKNGNDAVTTNILYAFLATAPTVPDANTAFTAFKGTNDWKALPTDSVIPANEGGNLYVVALDKASSDATAVVVGVSTVPVILKANYTVTIATETATGTTDAKFAVAQEDGTALVNNALTVESDATGKVKVTYTTGNVITSAVDETGKATVAAGTPTDNTTDGTTSCVYTISAVSADVTVTFTVAAKDEDKSGEITLNKGTGEESNISTLPPKATMENGTATVEITVAAGRTLVAPTSTDFTVNVGTPDSTNKYTVTITLKAATFPESADLTFTTEAAQGGDDGDESFVVTLTKDATSVEDANLVITVPAAVENKQSLTFDADTTTGTVTLTTAKDYVVTATVTPTGAATVSTPTSTGTDTLTWTCTISNVTADATVAFKAAAPAPAPAEKYTIKFAAGTGASGTMANVEVAKNASGATEYPVPKCTFTTPTGKEFDVWTVTPSTVTITNGKLSIPADFDTATEITLTATWKDAAPETPDNTVTMTPEVEGDKASSDFSDSLTPDEIGELVNAAESATDKVVTLDASEVTGNAAVKEAEVTIPTAIVNAVEGSTADVKLAVATPVGTVTLPKDAVTEVKAANTAVKLSIAPATGTGLPTGVVDVKFVKANAATETVEISTPVSLKLKAPAGATKVYAYLYKSVNNAFKAYKLNKDDTAYTVVDGFVTFTAPHLSCYGLSATKNNDAVEEKPAKPTSTATWATSTNFINGLITVSCDAIKSGDKCVVQLTKKPGAGELNLITVVTASEDGKLVFPGKNPKGEDKIAVWILPANANANTATSDDMTNIAYNLSITTATAN